MAPNHFPMIQGMFIRAPFGSVGCEDLVHATLQQSHPAQPAITTQHVPVQQSNLTELTPSPIQGRDPALFEEWTTGLTRGVTGIRHTAPYDSKGGYAQSATPETLGEKVVMATHIGYDASCKEESDISIISREDA